MIATRKFISPKLEEKFEGIERRKHNKNLEALVNWASENTTANPHGVCEYFKSWYGMATDLEGAKQAVIDSLALDPKYFDEY